MSGCRAIRWWRHRETILFLKFLPLFSFDRAIVDNAARLNDLRNFRATIFSFFFWYLYRFEEGIPISRKVERVKARKEQITKRSNGFSWIGFQLIDEAIHQTLSTNRLPKIWTLSCKLYRIISTFNLINHLLNDYYIQINIQPLIHH